MEWKWQWIKSYFIKRGWTKFVWIDKNNKQIPNEAIIEKGNLRLIYSRRYPHNRCDRIEFEDSIWADNELNTIKVFFSLSKHHADVFIKHIEYLIEWSNSYNANNVSQSKETKRQNTEGGDAGT